MSLATLLGAARFRRGKPRARVQPTSQIATTIWPTAAKSTPRPMPTTAAAAARSAPIAALLRLLARRASAPVPATPALPTAMAIRRRTAAKSTRQITQAIAEVADRFARARTSPHPRAQRASAMARAIPALPTATATRRPMAARSTPPMTRATAAPAALFAERLVLEVLVRASASP